MDVMAKITVRPNGPLIVEGDDVVVVDVEGQPYEIVKRPFKLCRCGHSATKPFCDATHKTIGFTAAEAAVPPATEKAAQ
jgi:CDGSH-type Zn-finger protein